MNYNKKGKRGPRAASLWCLFINWVALRSSESMLPTLQISATVVYVATALEAVAWVEGEGEQRSLQKLMLLPITLEVRFPAMSSGQVAFSTQESLEWLPVTPGVPWPPSHLALS